MPQSHVYDKTASTTSSASSATKTFGGFPQITEELKTEKSKSEKYQK